MAKMELKFFTLFVIPMLSIPIFLYLMYIGIKNYQRELKNRVSVYFTLANFLFAFAMILYAIRSLASEGQIILAEISLGGSLVLIMVAFIF